MVISESWSTWTDSPQTESPTHRRLSARTRKPLEDLHEAAEQRQAHAEVIMQAQASHRAEKLKAEREHEAEVRQRHDDAIKQVGETTAHSSRYGHSPSESSVSR